MSFTKGDKEYLLFSYGTLQPGGSLYSLIIQSQVRPPRRASVAGFELYATKGDQYPYMVRSHSPALEVQGTILTCKGGRQLDYVVNMELGAGYILGEAETTYLKEGEELKLLCSAFLLPRKNFHLLGTYIPSGDWLAYDKANEMRYLDEKEIEEIPVKTFTT